jgi:hypothetical protein
VRYLKHCGIRTTYFGDAHSLPGSRQAFHDVGIDFDKLFPHLSDRELFRRYSEGCFLADQLVCASQASKTELERKYKEYHCDLVATMADMNDNIENWYMPKEKYLHIA